MKNYYAVLGISPSANMQQIQVAFQDAVIKSHQQSNNFANSFSEILEAHETLSDHKKKKIYDQKLADFYKGSYTNHNVSVLSKFKDSIKSSINKTSKYFYKLKALFLLIKNEIKQVRISKENLKLLRNISIISAVLLLLIYLCRDCNCNNYKQPKTTIDPLQKWEETKPSTKEVFGQNDSVVFAPVDSLIVPKQKSTLPNGAVMVDDKETHYSHLNNGDSPFDNCFGQGVYGGNAILTVENGTTWDAIVLLYDVNTGSTIRNEYIRANSSFPLTGIRQGSYKIQVLYGENWSPNVASPCGSIGFFEIDDGYDETENAIFLTDGGGRYSNDRYTLHAVIGGNSKSKKISKREFFKR